MIDTTDTIDTCEFKIASKVVSMVILGIDTIDTKGSTPAPATVPRRAHFPS